MKLKTSCPHCQTSLAVRADLLAKRIKCPGCQQSFIVETARSPFTERSLDDLAEGSLETPPAAFSETFPDKSSEKSIANSEKFGSLGRYELLGILGQGGYGRVYRAYDPQLDRVLALKVPTFPVDDLGKARRFQAESKSAARLRHPNIVPTFESGQIDKQFYIASQFIEGKPLSEIIKSGSIDARQAAQWVSRIAHALAYAHDTGIVHRDVKPHNVMLDDRSEPQLMDFGLAKRVNEDAAMTTEGALLGTPAYMAPEQARGDMAHVGPAADQYAVGAILYELLTGKRAFDGSPHSVIAQILSSEPKALRSINPQIPWDLEAITQKAMSKEISGRYATCHELAADLDRWLQGEATIARPITSVERLTRWAKRNRGLASALAGTAAALVLAAVLGILFAGYQASASRQISLAAQRIESEQTKTLEALNTATSAKDRAEREKQAAEQQKQIAEDQTTIANERRQAEAQQRELADRRLEESQANVYVANIRLADAKWNAGDIDAMNAALDRLRPQPGEKDRRGWEWNYLWNLSHSEIATIPGNPEAKSDDPYGVRFSHVVYSPDGLSVLTIGGVPTVRNAWTGEAKLSLSDEPNSVGGCFSPDGRWIFTGTSRSVINCWNALTGVKRYSLTASTSPYAIQDSLVVSKDGSRLAGISSNEHKANIWEAETGKHIATLNLPSNSFSSDIALSPDGRLAATTTYGAHSVTVWDTQGGTLIRQLKTDDFPKGVCFSPDGRHLASGWSSGIAIWNADDGQQVSSIRLEKKDRWQGGGAWNIRYSADGNKLVSSSNNSITVRDVATGTEQVTIVTRPSPQSVDFSPDGRWLVTAWLDGTIKFWDAASGTADHRIQSGPYRVPTESKPPVSPAKFSSDGRKILSYGRHFTTVWDLESGALQEQIRLPTSKDGTPVFANAFSIDEQQILGLEELFEGEQSYPNLRAWNRSTGEQLTTIAGNKGEGPYGFGMRIVSSANGTRLATTDYKSRIIRIWDTKAGVELSQLAGHTSFIWTAAFSPDARHLVSGDSNYDVMLWDITTGKQVRTMKGNEGQIFSVDFSPQGDRIVSGSGMQRSGGTGDNAIRVWDTLTGEVQLVLRGHLGDLKSVHFSPDGQRLISAGHDNTVRIWDARTGQEYVTLRVPFQVAAGVGATMSPDGTRILCGGSLYQGAEWNMQYDIGTEFQIWDGRPESDWTVRATERAARSSVSYFRGKSTTIEELIEAIRNDPAINAEVRMLALKFASQQPVKVVEVQYSPVQSSARVLRDAFTFHRLGDKERLAALLTEAQKDFPDDLLLQRQVAHLQKLLNPPSILKLPELPADLKTVQISDIEMESMTVGWSVPMRNRGDFSANDNVLLEADGKFFESGLWAHAPSRYALRLGRNWKLLTSQFGIRDNSTRGTVVFVVRGDGKELFRSETMTHGKIGALNIPVADVNELELIVEDAGNGNTDDWSLWLNPQLSR